MALECKVGSFTGSTGTGAQAITGIGFQPKALILFTSGRTTTGFAANYRLAVGFATSPTEAYCVAAGSDSGQTTTNTARRMAQKAITIVDPNFDGTLEGEADLQSFDSDGFTLNWTDGLSAARIINYIALGGSDITNAKVVAWNVGTASTGDVSVSSVGFKPDCVIHAVSAIDVSALPANSVWARMGLGAMDKDGNQCADSFASADGVSPSNTDRGSRTDSCIAYTDASGAWEGLASFKSMDTNGFTVTVTDAFAVATRGMMSLCLKGGSYKVGNFDKDNLSTTSRLDGLGFKPKGMLLTEVRYISRNVVLAQGGGIHSWDVGATDGTNQRAIAVRDPDNLATTDVTSYQSNTSANVGLATASALAHEVQVTSFDDDGVSMTWPDLPGSGGYIFYFVAFGDAPVSSSAGFKVKVGDLTVPGLGSYAVTGVGFQPKVVIIYTIIRRLTPGFIASYHLGWGAATANEQYSVSIGSTDNQDTSDTYRRMAAKLISAVDGAGTLQLEATLTSMDSDGFTLNWTTNAGWGGYDLGYIALGGDDLTDTKLVTWDQPTSVGDKAVTGVGFKPDCVINFGTNDATIPQGNVHAVVCMGMMDKHGNQFANGMYALDGQATSDVVRWQSTGSCYAMGYVDNAFYQKASFKSMDTDGFTVNFSARQAVKVISLCLKGGSYKVGSFSKPATASASSYQTVGGVGFVPAGILMSSVNNLSSGSVVNHGVWNFGATSGRHNQRQVHVADLDAQNFTVADAYWGESLVAVSDSGSMYAEGRLASLDNNGFSVDWFDEHNGTYEFCYLAFGNSIVEDAVLDTGTTVKVGSFTTTTSAGLQQITGLGFRPKAIIFYSSTVVTTPGFRNGAYPGLGFSAGGGKSYSVATASANGVSPSNSSRRMAAKAFVLIAEGELVDGEADLESFDADGFTLDWTDAFSSSGIIINYVAIGGIDLEEANVVAWETATTIDNKSVTGTGFQPGLVIHAGAALTSIPSSAAHAGMWWGAMDSAGNQWTNGFAANDNISPSVTGRHQLTDRVIADADPTTNTFYVKASYVSMDTDGFTVNFDDADAVAGRDVASLCLKGPNFKVGSFTTRSGLGSQSVSGVGFEPKGLITAHYRGSASASPTTHAGWGIGAASGVGSEKAISITDQDAVATTVAQGYQQDKLFSAVYSGSTILWEANVTSFDSDGWTQNYTAETEGGTRQVLYLAIGDAAVSGFTGWGVPV